MPRTKPDKVSSKHVPVKVAVGEEAGGICNAA